MPISSPLNNPDFEYSSSSATYWTTDSTCSIVTLESDEIANKNQLKIQRSSLGTSTLKQSVYLNPGTYTFSISVSERTKQFGILKSVGATKKQIRKSVLYEAAVLCVIGIPTGLISGCLGIAVTFYFLSDSISTFLADLTDLKMQFVFSPAAIIAASVISFVTVIISAYIPAKKAIKILHSRLYAAIVSRLAPSIPPITTAPIAIGANAQIIPPCAIVAPNGDNSQ